MRVTTQRDLTMANKIAIKIAIKTLWGWRKSEEEPELLEAWDEYTAVEVNPRGWEEACKRALLACGDDLYAHRYIDMLVDFDAILAAFGTPEVEADVEVAQ